jgi:hypothetical protein
MLLVQCTLNESVYIELDEAFSGQFSDYKINKFRTNGFAITTVPIPAAAWLFGSALGLLGWLRRKSNLRKGQADSVTPNAIKRGSGIMNRKTIRLSLVVTGFLMSLSANAALFIATDPTLTFSAESCTGFACVLSGMNDEPAENSALGQWDENLDGLNVSADVGLWLDNRTLLGSVPVRADNSEFLFDDYRFTDLSSAEAVSTSTVYAMAGNDQFGGQTLDSFQLAGFDPLLSTTIVPVPAALPLMGSGLALLGFLRRQRKAAQQRAL